MKTLPLSAATLAAVAERVPVPGYDRCAVTPGVVHLGVGAFHRAHQAVYFDDLMERSGELHWGIRGIEVLPSARPLVEALNDQDGLFTITRKASDGAREVRVIGSLLDVVPAFDDPDAAVEALSDERIHLVTLTVTEGGYRVDPVTGRFDLQDPDVQADLSWTAGGGGAPRTIFALLVEALRRRRRAGLPAFTIASCDNVLHNGDVARTALTTFAGQVDPEFAVWIEQHVAFPNSMVDGITPRTTDLDRAELRSGEHIDDDCSVVAESWTQWVIEDRFSDIRPALETVGAEIVEDVEPYELVKLRMLNASHQVVAHLGRLLGLEYVHEVLADQTLAAFLDRYLEEEAAPTIQAPRGFDLDHYRAVTLERFANSHIRDTLARQCTDTSDRIPTFLLPVVRDLRRDEKPFSLSAAVIAAWALSCEGTDEDGNPLEVVDRRADALSRRARSADSAAFLEDREIFGDLSEDSAFITTVTELRGHLRTAGVMGTVKRLLA